MNKKFALTIKLTVILASILIACQPETTVQNQLSPAADLPKLPTARTETISGLDNTPVAAESTLPPKSDARATAEPGSGDQAATMPTNETPPAPVVEIPLAAEALVAFAKKDLAEQFEVVEDEIKVVSVKAVVWPDGSLGCPQPGMVYAQVLTPGFQILLSYQGVETEYHSDDNDTVVKCDGDFLKPLPPIPVDPGEIKDGEPWMPVD